MLAELLAANYLPGVWLADDDLKNEGKVDQAKGDVKGKVDDAADTIRDKV